MHEDLALNIGAGKGGRRHYAGPCKRAARKVRRKMCVVLVGDAARPYDLGHMADMWAIEDLWPHAKKRRIET